MIKHLIDSLYRQFTDVSICWFGQAHKLLSQGRIGDVVNFTYGFESLIFQETFLTDRFKEQSMNKWSNNLWFEFIKFLMCKYFCKECECLFRVVRPEIIDLCNDLLIEFGQQLTQEGGLKVFISLTQCGWINWNNVLMVWNWMVHSLD